MVFGLFGGKDVEIGIELDRGDGAYAAGETVGANIRLATGKGGKVREVRAGLVRKDRYQAIERRRDSDGDWRDYEVWKERETWVTREALANEGALAAGADEAYRFEWQIPHDAAPSCAGKIVQITWLVKVTVDRAMARDQNEELEIGIVAPPPGEHVQPGEYGEMNANAGVVMRLDLPTLELVEGDAVRGRLLVEPSQSIDAREVRVELVRDERVVPGDRVHVEQVEAARVQVAQSPKLTPGTPVAYDFELVVPETACPTHDTGDTSITWMLRGTIDRPMRGDYCVTQWVGVYNGRPAIAP
jgi:hypothetical protein